MAKKDLNLNDDNDNGNDNDNEEKKKNEQNEQCEETNEEMAKELKSLRDELEKREEAENLDQVYEVDNGLDQDVGEDVGDETKNKDMDTKNNNRRNVNMSSDKKYIRENKGEPKSPQDSGINMAAVQDYAEAIMTVSKITYDSVSEFLMDSIQELKPMKVLWERYNYDKLTRSIKPDTAQAVDTISKITGAKFHPSDNSWSGGFDAVPILVFQKHDIVREINYDDNLGAVSRQMWELDFNKLQRKNKKFFPKYGMVTSHDELNNLVQVNVNIINVLISALGFDPSEFGSPDKKDKLFLYPKQEPAKKQFKITVLKNKYFSDRLIKSIASM